MGTTDEMTVSAYSPPLVLLAGGLATRLGPMTSKVPKSMMEVAGEPFIAHQLRLLAGQGIDDIVLCTGHLGGMIEAFVGNGAAFGCRVRYSSDGDTLLGTGGALRRALPLLGETFWVMYGDSYLDIAYAPVLDAFAASGARALMTVFRNEGRWDTSNVEFADGRVLKYDKVERTPAMAYIDYGLGILTADVIGLYPPAEAFDLAGVYRDLARAGELAGYEVTQRFYEIGSPAGLADADTYLRGR